MLTKKLNVPRILLLTGSLSLLIVYVWSWMQVMTNPRERTASDFMAFYAGGRSMLEHSPAAAYDLAHLKSNQEKVLGFSIADREVMPFMHPPFILPVLWLTAHFEYVPALHVWAGFLLVLCVLCAMVGVRLVPGVVGMNKVAIWAGLILFFPLFISIVNGQDSALLLLGAMLWYYGFVCRSGWVAGLGLALMTIRPQIALVLAVPFFFNVAFRKTWWWFCLGSSVLVVFSVLLIGWDGVENFLHILFISAGGEGYKINEASMFNLIGLLKRTLPDMDAQTIRMIGWGGNLAGLIGLCLLWWRSRTLPEGHIALAVIVAILASLHLHYHDLVLLIVPALVVMRRWLHDQKVAPDLACLFIFCLSLIFVFTYSFPLLVHPVSYLVMVALLIFTWRFEGGHINLGTVNITK